MRLFKFRCGTCRFFHTDESDILKYSLVLDRDMPIYEYSPFYYDFNETEEVDCRHKIDDTKVLGYCEVHRQMYYASNQCHKYDKRDW